LVFERRKERYKLMTKKNIAFFIMIPFIIGIAGSSFCNYAKALTESPQLWNLKTVTVYDFMTGVFLHPLLIVTLILIFLALYILWKAASTIEA